VTTDGRGEVVLGLQKKGRKSAQPGARLDPFPRGWGGAILEARGSGWPSPPGPPKGGAHLFGGEDVEDVLLPRGVRHVKHHRRNRGPAAQLKPLKKMLLGYRWMETNDLGKHVERLS